MNEKVEGLWRDVQDVAQEVENLRKKIIAGEETFGNNFDDFVFCKVGANPNCWEPFYSLNDQMTLSEGQAILVLNSLKEPAGPRVEYAMPTPSGVMAPRVIHNTEYNMAYGILTGKGLDFDLEKDEIIFPNGGRHVNVSGTAIFESNLELKSLEVKPGNIVKKVWDLPHLCNGYSPEMLSALVGAKSSRILVGAEVGVYFRGMINGAEAYAEMKEKL